MTEQEAKAKANELIDQLVSSGGIELDSDERTVITDSNAVDLIATALLSAHRVPDGCVRLPDGRDVKVLGTLPMTADGCVIGTNADLYSWWFPQYTDDEGICQHSSTGPIVSAPHQCYSTRAAAEAARREGDSK